MFLKELIRFSTQHRTLYCYLILSVWIFLLIAGMYKYIGNPNIYHTNGFINLRRSNFPTIQEKEYAKFKNYKQRCGTSENLIRKEDGGSLDGWKLQGVLVVIRHGDRGPMSHVRGVSSIDCGMDGDMLLHKYRSFLLNATNPSGTNHMYWNKMGSFHGFSLLPPTQKACLLGQLTYKGISQLLHVGDELQHIYGHQLGLLKPQQSKPYINSTPHSLLNSDEVVVFTTRYRRTFQSAMALLFSFLPHDKWLSLNILESHSMAFCFADCACPQAEVLRKKLSSVITNHLPQHESIAAIVQWVGSTLLQHTPNGVISPNEVVDAILTVICHDAPLPCRRINSNTPSVTTSNPTMVELNDVINIDQDDTALNLIEVPTPTSVIEETDGQTEGCVEPSHISALMTYSSWLSTKEVNHAYYQQIGLLRSYGMIRHIVSYMLKMISGDRTKFVIYSGHDWTLQYLTAALRIKTGTTFISYAARLAFEVYKSEQHTDYYFRVLYNGKDVTAEISFCEGGKSLRVTRDNRGNKADLCPIENIIRFLHEDYFASLNATNFKDACTIIKRPNEN